MSKLLFTLSLFLLSLPGFASGMSCYDLLRDLPANVTQEVNFLTLQRYLAEAGFEKIESKNYMTEGSDIIELAQGYKPSQESARLSDNYYRNQCVIIHLDTNGTMTFYFSDYMHRYDIYQRQRDIARYNLPAEKVIKLEKFKKFSDYEMERLPAYLKVKEVISRPDSETGLNRYELILTNGSSLEFGLTKAYSVNSVRKLKGISYSDTETKAELKELGTAFNAGPNFTVGQMNSHSDIGQLIQINGKSIQEIEKGLYETSNGGNSLRSHLTFINQYVREKLGLTHQEIGVKLQSFINLWIKNKSENFGRTLFVTIDGVDYELSGSYYRSLHYSAYDKDLLRGTRLQLRIKNLSSGQLFITNRLEAKHIYLFGDYDNHPAHIAKVLGLTP